MARSAPAELMVPCQAPSGLDGNTSDDLLNAFMVNAREHRACAARVDDWITWQKGAIK
jgi:hypothetical protein